MFRRLLLILGIGLFGLGSSQTVNKEKLDSYFQTLEQNNKVMGSFAIVKDDQIVYSKAIGFSDVENAKKADEMTVYRIASISKTFTAVLIMKAVEEGKLKLQDNLHRFFPEIRNSEKITLENLLQHRSGIHSFTDDVQEYFSYYEKPVSGKELLAKIVKGGSDFQPGTKYAYSNSNYVLLALILEKMYKKPYAQLIEVRISKPLRLNYTKVGGKIESGKNAAFSYTYSDSKYTKSAETDMSVPLGAGNLVSTPSELLKFIVALANGKLVTKEGLAKMQNWKGHYGLGIFEVPFNDKKGFGHNGGIDKFNSVLYYFPDGKVGFAMITNQSNYDNNQISITALKATYGMDFQIPDFKTVSVSAEDLKKLEGTYAAAGFPLKLNIFVKNGQLFGQGTGQAEFPLEANSKTRFMFDMAGITMEFDPERGKMNFSQMGNNIIFTKE